MSLKATQWALYDVADRLDANELRLLMIMADIADVEGRRIFPSVANLADWCHCSVRTIRNKLASLESKGLISRDDQTLAASIPANHRPIVWRLNMDQEEDTTAYAKNAHLNNEDDTPAADVQTGVQNNPDVQTGVQLDRQTGVQAVCTQTHNIRIKPITRESTREQKTDIDQWAPSLMDAALADRLGADLEAEEEKFRDHVKAGGHQPADTDAAFRNWLRRGDQLGYNKSVKTTPSSVPTGRAQPDRYQPREHVHTGSCAHTKAAMAPIAHLFDHTVPEGQWGISEYNWAAQAYADTINQGGSPDQAVAAAKAIREEIPQ
ncbi:helix-turn-helix domain-containing protein [Bifidobacterium cuniculi]|uniref:Cryptic prophage protein n=1 Tax=Bifidobacterium cuniculi TaxID=1688 RepID=A0A087B4G9_9BIFI|nr:helix-turn-helix domain-containing protein [Bifidobacterium cuniculi]KFI65919.1 cryptic prophage protein [Bifidobacterium cuniculi]